MALPAAAALTHVNLLQPRHPQPQRVADEIVEDLEQSLSISADVRQSRREIRRDENLRADAGVLAATAAALGAGAALA